MGRAIPNPLHFVIERREVVGRRGGLKFGARVARSRGGIEHSMVPVLVGGANAAARAQR